VTRWAQTQTDLSGVVLVGSYARGSAKASSDLDLILMVKDPALYLADPSWAGCFGRVKTQRVEDWGQVTSLRVGYARGVEVEFGLATGRWIDLPLDPGTRKVLEGGYQLLFDRDGTIQRKLDTLGILPHDACRQRSALGRGTQRPTPAQKRGKT